ncbi:MAG: hypothetical protein ACP6IP_06110 [Candidatus Njordarchaeia archaeon]
MPLEWNFVLYRLIVIIVSILLILSIGNFYKRTKFANYLLLEIMISIVAISSLFEVIASLSTSYNSAFIWYNITAISRTLIIFLIGVFFVSYSEGAVKKFSYFVVSSLATIEILESMLNPPVLRKIGFMWYVISARSYLAYSARTTLLIFSLIVFIYYLIIYIRRTQLKTRRLLAIFMVASISFLSIGDGFVLLSSYPRINQLLPALAELGLIITIFVIIAMDPYFLIFFRGQSGSIIIYRDDGVLLANIELRGGDYQKSLLTANLLSALSNYGAELLFRQEELQKIMFGEDTVIIVPYREIRAAIIGKRLHESIKNYVILFLKEFYKIYETNIVKGVYIVPSDKSINELFMKTIGTIIL